MGITIDQLNKIVPYGRKKSLVLIDFLNETLDKFSINTPLRISAFLAQVAHESASFVYMEEIASGKAYDNRADLGNTEPEAIEIAKKNNTTAGQFYKGHGLIQITGYYNHKKCGEALGVDAVNNPKILAAPEYAVKSAGWYWDSRNLNPLADKEDFRQITKLINGGYNGYEDRLQFYDTAKKVLL